MSTERKAMLTRENVVLIAVAVVSAALLWLVPPVGFVAAIVMLVLLAPWGRTLAERTVISGLVLIGVVAIAFPRASTVPVTAASARVLLIIAMAALIALSFVPAIRRNRNPIIPKPTISDVIVLVLAIVSAAWLMAAYVGVSAEQIVAGLFFSGWDNQGHFTTFANTFMSQMTAWPTLDGSIAWNQWYPTLHSTAMALAEHAVAGDGLTDRVGLLWPYVQWNAVTFALCLAALAWVGGDLASRLSGRGSSRWTAPVATAAVAAFGLLGSPAFLYNAGFTNFMMAVTIVVASSYVSARSWRSARVLGWFLVPLATFAVIGLWTPLALGLIPAGLIVAISLLRYRLWAGGAWLAANVVIAVVLGLTQTAAILGVEPGQTTSDFTSDLGAVTTGMAPFNLGLALVMPIVALGLALVTWRRGNRAMAMAVLGPVLGASVVALIFVLGADAAGVSRLESYYVLKPLDAALIAGIPLVAAMGAIVIVRVLAGLPRLTAAVGVIIAGVVLIGSFGYAGSFAKLGEGYSAAPGVQAGADRTFGIENSLIGLSIISAQRSAVEYPDYTTVLWDGAGLLPNLWVSSLHGVMSKSENRFYRDMPAFPYESTATGYVDLALNLDPSMRVAMLWFRPSSGELLDAFAASHADGRVVSVQVPMVPNDMCPECSPLSQ